MSEPSHYIIDLSRLPIGTHKFDFQLNDDFFSSLEKTEILSGQVVANAVLNLREEDYSLTIAVQGTVSVVCDRCLDSMAIEIDATDEWLSEDENASPTAEIDLSWLAYEIVSINIPLVHCHPTGACNPQMDLLLQSHLCEHVEPEE